MPSLSRRREMDQRSSRFESEFTISQLSKLTASPTRIREKLFKCGKCNHLYAERSRHCPRCDKKTMGELRPIPERERMRLKENEIRRINKKNVKE